jgi:hypothetical protein
MSTPLLSVLENLESVTGNLEEAIAPDDLMLEEASSIVLVLENLDGIMRRLRQAKDRVHSHRTKLLVHTRLMDAERMVGLMPFGAYGADGTMALYTQDLVQADSFFEAHLSSW